MEENENTGNRRGETSLRLSETANQALTKLTKEWKASSKKEAIEGMINYFKKLGISPLEDVPDTVGKRLEKRVDQVIAFIRQNEKIHREEIEKVLLFARQSQAGNNPAATSELATADDFVRMANVLVGLNKICEGLQTNDQTLRKIQMGILENLQVQNDMVTQRLAAYKDTAGLYEVIKNNMQKYTDSVLADPQKAPQIQQNFIQHFKKKLGITTPPETIGG